MLDLVEILKDCPKGTKLYSTIHGEVTLNYVSTDVNYPINVIWRDGLASFTHNGRYYTKNDGECILFPSKDQRDWSKFKVPVNKFDYNTLQHFDKAVETIKIDLEEQCRWYLWYVIISNSYPNASKDAVIKRVNEIVYKK